MSKPQSDIVVRYIPLYHAYNKLVQVKKKTFPHEYRSQYLVKG